MNFTKQYIEILNPETRVSKSLIRPRNIYRIVTYKDGDPATKTGNEARYVFVIGRLEDRIHCIKLNPIRPYDFTNFIGRIRDKKVEIKDNQFLDEILMSFSKDGKSLFETYIKNNPKIYSPKLGNYRVYLLKNITNVWEIRFEPDVKEKLFGGPSKNITQQRNIIQEEIKETDD